MLEAVGTQCSCLPAMQESLAFAGRTQRCYFHGIWLHEFRLAMASTDREPLHNV